MTQFGFVAWRQDARIRQAKMPATTDRNVAGRLHGVSISSVIQSCDFRARTTKIWTAVAACRGEAQRRLERSGDTAFRSAGCVPNARGALLPPQSKICGCGASRVGFYPCPPWLKKKLCGPLRSQRLCVNFIASAEKIRLSA